MLGNPASVRNKDFLKVQDSIAYVPSDSNDQTFQPFNFQGEYSKPSFLSSEQKAYLKYSVFLLDIFSLIVGRKKNCKTAQVERLEDPSYPHSKNPLTASKSHSNPIILTKWHFSVFF